MRAADFAGPGCGRRYEKEYLDKYRDCLIFYKDGRVRFERYCYGEGACFVFGVWAGMDTQGALSYQRPFDPLVEESALPQRLTAVRDGVLYFDEKRWKWEAAADLAADPKNGYGRLKCLLLRLKKG